MLPRISVIVPSFNQGCYLERNLSSLIEQGYPDLEILVRDGGSTDNSVSVIERFRSRIANVKIGPDGGQAKAINDAYREATGAWVAWQNSDDYYLPGTLHGVAAADAANPTATVAHGPVLRVGERGEPVEGGFGFGPFTRETVCMNDLGSNQAHFYRREHLPQNYLVDESLDHSLDHELNLRLLAEGRQFVFSDKVRGAFRYHDASKSVRQVHVRCAESFALGEKYCCDSRLPIHLRLDMLRSMRDDCVVGCFTPEAAAFRQRTIRYAKIVGLRRLEPFLLRRFILSYLPMFRNG
ncbi:MAG: hypothetical protein BWK80_41180 [Desulfobacteraceae bacterium IS3]|nr:MAG: hypothetical protein BWK80_41180 [Desulfobacteraceae bacterium IS3]